MLALRKSATTAATPITAGWTRITRFRSPTITIRTTWVVRCGSSTKTASCRAWASARTGIATWRSSRYVLEGALEHKDSMGNGESSARRRAAYDGRQGVTHSEFNPSSNEPVHFLQIWLEPATPGLKPTYQQLSLTEQQKLGKLVLVASPEGGGPLKIHQDANVLIGQVEAGRNLDHPLATGRKAWVHVIRGAANVNGRPSRPATPPL